MDILRKNKDTLLICCALIILSVAVFWQVRNFEFINFDDQVYVYQNPHITSGFTKDTIVWAFTSTKEGAWQPLTWLSYLVDYHFSELDPEAYHLTNMGLHIANTVLLFILFVSMTGSKWKSAFVAAIFAVHPLHVEPVAWIASRKDVLSTMFWVLALIAYVQYTKRNSALKYILVVSAFSLGIMSKPMVMTLPLVLLLLDYWPLNRTDKIKIGALIKEKIPLFAISALSLFMAFAGQHSGGGLKELERYTVGIRLANAALSYIVYIVRTFWPMRLGIYYPHPLNTTPVWITIAATTLLVLLTWYFVKVGTKRRYLLVGWIWYASMLLPVSGLAQFGNHANADRFMYVPLIGLSIIVAWGLPELLEKSRWRTDVLATLGLSSVLAMAVLAHAQTSHWADRTAIWRHTIKATGPNALAHCSLGTILLTQGKADEAVVELRQSIQIKPKYGYAHYNLALAFDELGHIDQAIPEYYKAIELDPKNAAPPYTNLGYIEMQRGRVDEAIALYKAALRVQPDYEIAKNNLDIALQIKGER